MLMNHKPGSHEFANYCFLLLSLKYASILAYKAMDIQVESHEDRRIIRIKGKVTFESCAILQSRLDTVAKEDVREFVIDFKEVPFIDSSGIGEVLRLFKHVREKGGEVILINPNRKLRDLFSMYRFDRFMKIHDEVEPGAE
jgi:anti-sigma B factor antagonist